LRRQRGFSLVEMLVALGLAGLVVAGALQLQTSFTRQSNAQQAIGEVQQTLRSAMAVIARTVRTSGSGMGPTSSLATPNCASKAFFGVQFFNSNVFPWAAYDATGGPPDDLDPDWLRVIAATPDQAIAHSTGNTTAQTTVDLTTGLTAAASGWGVGDLVQVLTSGGATVNPFCTRAVSSVTGNVIGHVSASCINAAPCTAAPADSLVRRFAQEVDFRVFPGTAFIQPRLAMRMAPVGDTTSTNWRLIAEGIEDMQISLVLIDERICSSIDDPIICQPAMAKAVQITLVGRTLSTVQGAPPSYTGGYEDRPSLQVTDGYIRRALTERVELRN
jgi:prepilin-type N-terminal cleavage/methylation domain-containing protein